jgi:drug/metabolite transporter (DMT)-like permease
MAMGAQATVPRHLPRPATLGSVTAILGGLAAAVLWSAATLSSSRSSRMLGSIVVLAWVMVIGTIVGLPLALATPLPAAYDSFTNVLLAIAGICYVLGLMLAYAALTIGKVSIVAPIVATEGAVAAVIAIALGDTVGLAAGLALGIIATGVILSAAERSTTDVPVGGIELVADALASPLRELDAAPGPMSPTAPMAPGDLRKSAILAIGAALIFGVGLVASGRAAAVLPPVWVAFAARVIGVAIITVPIALSGRLRTTRAAIPLLVIAGVGEMLGSTASAWGARESIPIVAVMGSQFAAISAVAAYFLFGERLARIQVLGVILIIVGVTVLAAQAI